MIEFRVIIGPQGMDDPSLGLKVQTQKQLAFRERLEPSSPGSHVVHLLRSVHTLKDGSKGPQTQPCPRGGTRGEVKAGRDELREQFWGLIKGTWVLVSDRPGLASFCDLGQPISNSTAPSCALSFAEWR